MHQRAASTAVAQAANATSKQDTVRLHETTSISVAGRSFKLASAGEADARRRLAHVTLDLSSLRALAPQQLDAFGGAAALKGGTGPRPRQTRRPAGRDTQWPEPIAAPRPRRMGAGRRGRTWNTRKLFARIAQLLKRAGALTKGAAGCVDRP